MTEPQKYFVFDLDKSKRYGIIQSDYLDNVREHFSAEDKTARIKQIRFGHFIPSRKYVITPSGRFDLGMFEEIYKYVISLQIPYKIIVTEPLKTFLNTQYSFYNIPIESLNMTFRDYQEDVVKKCLERGRGVVIVPTAGGKTYIMAALIKNIKNNINKPDHKTLIIVPRIQLVEQTYKDFIEYGINQNTICKWSGENELNKDANIVIAGVNILQSKLTDLSFLNNINLLLWDECIRKNTKIHTKKGLKNIQDIKRGDLVLSKNTRTNKIEYKQVLKTYKNIKKSNNYKSFYKIVLENGKLIYVTPNHKLKTTNRGYIRADQLTTNDDIDCLFEDNVSVVDK